MIQKTCLNALALGSRHKKLENAEHTMHVRHEPEVRPTNIDDMYVCMYVRMHASEYG